MENIKCIFCSKENDKIIIEEDGYMGRKCSQCGLIYISPRPSFEEILNLYGHDDAHISAELHISSEFSQRLHAKHNLRIMTSFINNGTILEIGSGAGYFLDEARKIGFDPYAIEFNPIQAEFIRNELGIPCEESPLNYSLFDGEKFDVVYHCDVISHFFDPISEFKRINEKIKEGGWLMFETGNFGEVNQSYFQYLQRFQYPDHLFFFSMDNLRDLLQRTDFELIKVYRYSILPWLMTLKVLGKVVKAMKGKMVTTYDQDDRHSSKQRNEGNRLQDTSQSFANARPNAKWFIRIAWNCLGYLLRYKIGYIVPKARRPQTVIVIARKREK